MGLAVKYQIKSNNLKKNYGLITGTVTDFVIDHRGAGGNVEFTFELEGKEYKNVRGYANIVGSEGDVLIGKHFPVAYEKGNIKNSRMLLTSKDFESFSIPFPDSLKWVKEIEK